MPLNPLDIRQRFVEVLDRVPTEEEFTRFKASDNAGLENFLKSSQTAPIQTPAAPVQKATVFNPETGERKAVTVGDPNAFAGGFVLETANDTYASRQAQKAQPQNLIKIPNPETLSALTKSGLKETDVVRKDAQGNIVASGGTMYVGEGSKFAEQLKTPPVQALSTPIDAGTLAAGAVNAPTLPAPQTPVLEVNYANTLKQSLDTFQKQTLEQKNTEIEAKKKEIADLNSKLEATIKESSPEKLPFASEQQALIKNQIAGATYESEQLVENLKDRQRMVNEIESLYTTALSDIQAAKDVTGLASIRNPRINKMVEDAKGRIGILEAAIAGKDGLITSAYSHIDQSVNLINSSKQDELNYLNSLSTFYSDLKKTAGNELITIEKSKQDALNARTSLLEGEIKEQEKVGDFIKTLIEKDPANAEMLEKAGVKVNDSWEVINQKISKWLNQNPDFGSPKLSPTEAARLGVPFGTTEAQAARMNITPRFGTGGGGGSKTTPSDIIPKFTPDEIKRVQALGISGWDKKIQNVVLNKLTPVEQRKFLDDFNAEQQKRKQSLDPEAYILEWAAQQDKGGTSDFDNF